MTECQGDFLSKLREVLGPKAIIFTNQGYRRAEFFLPHADFDLIENELDHPRRATARLAFGLGSKRTPSGNRSKCR